MQAVLDFISANPYPTGAVVAVVCVLAYFKLRLVLKAVGAVLILGAIAYVLMFIFNLASTELRTPKSFAAIQTKPSMDT